MEPTQRTPILKNISTPTRIGRTYSVALTGMQGQIVAIEADIGNALPGFTLLGLPDQSLHEAKDRIRAAARNSGLDLTRRHLTVNLTPASLHKRGSVFDLAIVMAAWAADYAVRQETGPVFLAALGLDGSLQSAPGILPSVMAAVEAGYTHIVVAEDARAQAELVPGAQVHAYSHVTEVAHAFGAQVKVLGHGVPAAAARPQSPPTAVALDLADIYGQEEARWALEVAAAGGHHMLLQGPPGAGKTMLAQRLPTIMTEMDSTTALEHAAIHSLLEGSDGVTEVTTRVPFEAPHHSASTSALLGGGSGFVRPGAVSKAHGGVLFLDEAAEFKRPVLDALRQPLETGSVTLHRARHIVEFPASFQLVLATNPCPCGYGYGTGQQCRCTSLQRRRYASKLSGPLLDRVDIQITMEPVSSRHFTADGTAESSSLVAQRVNAALQRAKRRLKPFGLQRNHQIPLQLFNDSRLRVGSEGQRILNQALDQQRISARGYGRTMRVAWTIADLMELDRPKAEHVDMALYLRLNDKET